MCDEKQPTALPLPIIDVSNSEDKNSTVVSDVKSALEKFGFFYLKGHNIDFAPVLRLYNQLLADKEILGRVSAVAGGGVVGYYPVESINTNRIFGKEGMADCCEQFTWKQNISMQERESDPYLSSVVGLATNPNNPVLPPQYKKVFDEMYLKLENLARFLFLTICKAYGIDGEVWSENFRPHNCSSLSYLHYPNPTGLQDWDKGRLRMGSHRDLDVLTILRQSDSTGGLQVKPPCFSTWTDVPYVPDALVVNSGEILQYWTQGSIMATEHRVRMPTLDELEKSDRSSLAFAYLPKGNTTLVPFNPQTNFEGSTLGEFMKAVTGRYAHM